MASGNAAFKQIILTLLNALQHEFGRDVSSFYFGDVVIYPPSAFISPTGQYSPVISVSPSYNHPIDGEAWFGGEMRGLGIDILVLFNYTPFIEAVPTVAAGEEMLMDMVDRIFEFLRSLDMLTLYDTVTYAQVGEINWTWSPRQNQPIRGAVISYDLQVSIDYNT